jgi:uncharacterized protein VirK/YbjX
VLVAILHGIGQALEIEHMAGVSADGQVWNRGNSTEFVSGYDEFWISLGANPFASKFFHLPMRSAEKPLQAIKQNHRQRTKVKREFKKEIAEEVCRSFQRYSR